MADNNLISPEVFAKMQTGNPVAVYKKTILGKVEVSVLDPFSKGAPRNIMLYGDPNKNHQNCFVEVWSQMEEVYFERQNSNFFKSGTIIKLKDNKKPKRIKQDEEKSYENITDSDIEELVTAPFMKFKNELDKIDSEAVVYRILSKAEEMERPEKTMQRIRQRLAEIQNVDVKEE